MKDAISIQAELTQPRPVVLHAVLKGDVQRLPCASIQIAVECRQEVDVQSVKGDVNQRRWWQRLDLNQ